MEIAFNNLNAQWQIIKDKVMPQIEQLFERSNFILGDAVGEFEDMFKSYSECEYAVGVSNGTDALKLATQALTERYSTLVLIPANTFVATIIGIEQALPRADFILVDCDDSFQMNLDDLHKIIKANRNFYSEAIIVPVHLYGYMCNMNRLMDIADEYDCLVLEDASQAHGAQWDGQPAGSFGDVAAFSLYPGKNLGAAGDAGIVTTNRQDVYEKLIRLRNVGSVEKYVHEIRGGNHRLDTLQAIILKEKMPYIEDWNASRRLIVHSYQGCGSDRGIDNELVRLPMTPDGCCPVHHVYPVMVDDRESFTNHLDEHGIQWGLHYPTCIEEMPMYKHLIGPNKQALEFSSQMVSLPIHPFMSEEEVAYVCDAINKYKG